MKFLNELLETFTLLENSKLDKDIGQVISIINQHATEKNSFQDILIRIMAFSNGLTRPRTDVDEEIDVIPVLNDLVARGFVKSIGKGRYKRTEPLSKLMSLQVSNKLNDVIGGAPNGGNGRLSLEQGRALRSFLLNPGDLIGDKLNASPEIWKSGGKHSGQVKDVVKKTIIETDPSYAKLDSDAKSMLNELQTLSNPYDSFRVLKYLLKLQAHKKGYGNYIDEVKNTFKDDRYLDAFHGLENIGVINGNRIDSNAIDAIRNVIDWLQMETVENISLNDKLSAFLPNFSASATSVSASVHRGINAIVTDSKITDIVIPRLTQGRFDEILGSDLTDLKNEAKHTGRSTKYNIKLLADELGTRDVNEFKSEVLKLKSNRKDFKGEVNREAKRTGRFEEFIRQFSI